MRYNGIADEMDSSNTPDADLKTSAVFEVAEKRSWFDSSFCEHQVQEIYISLRSSIKHKYTLTRHGVKPNNSCSLCSYPANKKKVIQRSMTSMTSKSALQISFELKLPFGTGCY